MSCRTCDDNTLVIPLGVDYGYRWTLENAASDLPIDVTGWPAKMQIRNRPLPTGVLRATFTTADKLTTGNGYVDLVLEETDTAGWDWPQGVYDIHLWTPTNEGPFYLAGGGIRPVFGVTEGTP